MPDIIAETDRLVLRTIQESDAELQYRLLNTPMVMARLGGMKELHEIETKHAKSMALYAKERFSFLFMIEKSSGEMVGHCGLKRVDNALAKNIGDHEIGWLVREDRWRLGYAEEGVRAVFGWAFEGLDAPHVVALTSKLNVPSWRMMEKLGMQRRSDLDFDDPDYPPEDRTTILYSLSKTQWQEHNR